MNFIEKRQTHVDLHAAEHHFRLGNFSERQTALYIVVVSILVALSFCIYGARDDRQSFERAVTPVHVQLNPLMPNDSRLARSGAQS